MLTMKKMVMKVTETGIWERIGIKVWLVTCISKNFHKRHHGFMGRSSEASGISWYHFIEFGRARR